MPAANHAPCNDDVYMYSLLRKFNAFDAFAVLVLAHAVALPFLHFGYIVENVLYGIVVAAMAFRAGAHRKATLFISSVIVLTDALADSQRIIGDMDNADKCDPVFVAVVSQCALFVLVAYAVFSGEDDETFLAEQHETEAQFKIWIVIVIGVCALRSSAIYYDCSSVKGTLAQPAGMFRTVVLASACLANGEDETVEDD